MEYTESRMQDQIEGAQQSYQSLCEEVELLRGVLLKIGNYAHDHSTGPAVPDAMWDIRAMAYEHV